MSYPWIKDSQYGTTPLVTNYLEVTSPNGLYLNSTNSQVLLSNTGSSTPLPQTATLTNEHLYIAGGTSGTSPTHTEITDISIISNSHDNIYGGDSTTTIQGASMLMLNTQPNLSTSQQLQITPDNVILTANGGVPSSASWSSILAGGGATPNLSAVLTQGNDATGLGLFNVGSVQFTDMATTLSSASIAFGNNNGSITGLQTINGASYPPSASQNIQSVLSVGNDAGNQQIIGVNQFKCYDNATYLENAFLNFANNNGSISGVQYINGSTYPPYPTSPYGLNSVLTIDNNASGQNITGVNNIDVGTINGGAYPPSVSIPDLNNVLNQGNSAYHDIDMTNNQILNCNNINTATINGTAIKRNYTFGVYNVGLSSTGTGYGGTPQYLEMGTYQITYSIMFDTSIQQGAGNFLMCNAFCFLIDTGGGSYTYTTITNATGYKPSQLISYNPSSFQNSFTFTDNISVPNSQSYYLGVGQNNELNQYISNVYYSATLVQF